MLDSAANHNIKMIIPDGDLNKYASPQRFYYDANSDYFTTTNGYLPGQNDLDAERPWDDPRYYDKKALLATLPNAYMVQGVKYQPVDGNRAWFHYRVFFRVKVQRSGIVPSTTPIA